MDRRESLCKRTSWATFERIHVGDLHCAHTTLRTVSVGIGSNSIKVTGCSSRLYHSNYNNIKHYDLLVGTLNVDSIGVLQLGGWTLVLPRTLNLLVQWPAFFPSDAPVQGPSLVSQRSSPGRSHSLATVVGSLGTGLKSQCIKCIRTWCLRRLLLPQ